MDSLGRIVGRRIALVPAVLLVLLLALMIRLGFWQLDRADEKRAKYASFESQVQVTSISPDPQSDLERYSLVSLQGRYLSQRQIIMDGFSKNKTAGYQVLSPFVVNGGYIVMVNRGWRPWAGGRQEVGDIGLDEDLRVIRGRVDDFWRPGLVLGSGNSAERDSWPRLSVYPQHEEIRAWLDRDVLPWQLLLSTEEPDGFVREWRPSGVSPERHTGYAIQWFTMSVALVILALVSTRKSD